MYKQSTFALAASAVFAAPVALAASLSPAVPAPSMAALSPVVVTATRFAEDADQLPLGVSVITAKDIASSGVTTVNEAIMKLLGVPGRQDFYGGGNYSLDMRGFGQTAANNQVVVIDGQRVTDADLSTPFIAGVPIDEVERIEVLRGSGAVLYGDGATGGVISIITKAGSDRARHSGAQVYGALGSDRFREGRGSATLVQGEFSLDAAVGHRAGDNYRDNFHSRSQSQSVGGQWRRDGLRVGVSYAQDDLDTRLPGALSAAQYALNPRQASTPTNHADIHNQRLSAFARASLQDWELAFDAGRRHKELRSASGYFYDVNAEAFSLRAQQQRAFAGWQNSLVIGADVDNWYRQVLGLFGSNAHQHAHGVYVKNDITLPAGTRLSAGVRASQIDQYDGYGLTTEGRQTAWELGLTQPLATGLAAYARYGHSFRLPNVDEIGFTQPGVLLQPQTSRDLELGGRWTQAGTRAELRYYRNALTRELGYDGTVPNANSFSGLGANVNFDPTLRQGLELEVTHDWTSTLQTRAVAALRRATFRAGSHDGKDVPLVPRHSLSLRADWTLLPQQQLGAVLNLVSSQHPDYDNSCRIPGYATVDARYAIQWGPAQWSLGMTNLLDRKYYTQAYGCTGGVTTAIYPEAGRQLTTALRWQF